MSTRRHLPRIAGRSLVVCVSAALAVPAAEAQQRVNQSDVSGPAITTGDLLMFGEPGTVMSFNCPVAWGVRTTSESVVASLRESTLRAADETPDGDAIDAGVQVNLAALMTGGERRDEAERAILAALTPESNPSRGARRAARRLTDRLTGLLAVASRIDPLDPGYRAPSQLNAALGAYNSFIDASSGEFLREPSDALVGIRTVLSDLVVAALENENRRADLASVDEGGLACAPNLPPSPPPPPPPVRTEALSVCILTSQGPREVAAILTPSTGDTVVVVDGERRPFSEVYPDTVSYAGGSDWFIAQEPISIGGRQYLRYGLPGIIRREFGRIGSYRGVGLLALRSPDAAESSSVFVPVDGCMVQEYRPEERVRRVRG